MNRMRYVVCIGASRVTPAERFLADASGDVAKHRNILVS
jgi:hypothetical protein